MSDLRAFLAEHGITLISRAQWGARPPRYRNPLGPLGGGVTHHSVTGSSPEIAQVQGIQAYHMDSKGWSDIAYSILVGQSGNVYEGRSAAGLQYEWLARSGGTGDPEDATLLAICAIGNYETEQPSPGMLKAYQAIYTWIAAQGGAIQKGDRDFNQTACPGINLYNKIPFPPLQDDDDMPLSDADLAKITAIVQKEVGGVNARLIELKTEVDAIQGEVDEIKTSTDRELDGEKLPGDDKPTMKAKVLGTPDVVRDEAQRVIDQLSAKIDQIPSGGGGDCAEVAAFVQAVKQIP